MRSSGGRSTGGAAAGLSIGASVAFTAFGDALDAGEERLNHHAPPARITTSPMAMKAIGRASGVVVSDMCSYGAIAGGTRFLVACSNAYASSIRRGSLQAMPVKLTPYG